MIVRDERMTDAVQFFIDHAGFSYDPLTETADQGQRRCAEKLALAEQALSDGDASVEWVYDEDPDTSWMDAEQLDELERGLTCFMGAILRDAAGNVISSLWGIHLRDDGPTDPYGRVVEAELAHEAGPLSLNSELEISERAYWAERDVCTVD